MLRRRIRRSIDVLLVIPDITLAKSLIVQGWARPQVSRVTFELLRFEW